MATATPMQVAPGGGVSRYWSRIPAHQRLEDVRPALPHRPDIGEPDALNGPTDNAAKHRCDALIDLIDPRELPCGHVRSLVHMG